MQSPLIDEVMKALKQDLTRLRENASLCELSIKQQKAVTLLSEAERAARIDDKVVMSAKLEAIDFEERQWLIKLSGRIKAALAEEALIASYAGTEVAKDNLKDDVVSVFDFQLG